VPPPHGGPPCRPTKKRAAAPTRAEGGARWVQPTAWAQGKAACGLDRRSF
jgi:hypothetical protein